MRSITRGIGLFTVLAGGLAVGCQSSVEPRRPVQLVLAAGAEQSAIVGSPLEVSPVVRVLNVDGQPVPGVRVNFAIANGGGSITGSSVTTDANGRAAVGSWTLGSVGENHLTASTSGAQPLHIPAFGRCAVGGTLAVDASVSGVLATTDCKYPNGEFTDRYTMEIFDQQAIRFSQTSVAVNSFLEIQSLSNVVAFNNDETSQTDNAGFKILLAPGAYDVNPSSWQQGETGAYTVFADAAPENETGCDIVFVVPEVQTVQTLASDDCASGTFRYDAFAIYLHAGRTYSLSMNSTGFDTYLELLDYAQETEVAENDDANAGTTNARILYTPTISTFYLLLAANKLPSGLGTYTLIIQ